MLSTARWNFTAPLGPIELEELRWYLEQYAIWPSGVFRDRAKKVEQALATWGWQLHQAAFPTGPTGNARALSRKDRTTCRAHLVGPRLAISGGKDVYKKIEGIR